MDWGLSRQGCKGIDVGLLVRGCSVAALACAILSSELSAQTAVEYDEKSLNPYKHQQETFDPLNDGVSKRSA